MQPETDLEKLYRTRALNDWIHRLERMLLPPALCDEPSRTEGFSAWLALAGSPAVHAQPSRSMFVFRTDSG